MDDLIETALFRVEPELVAELHERDDEEILAFAGLHEDTVDMQPELYIFTCYLLYTRTRLAEHLEKAILLTEGWLAVTDEEDVDRLRRSEIFDMLSANMCQHNERTAQRSQLEHAIGEARHELGSNEEDDAGRADASEKLASLLYTQYTQNKEIPDLEEAIRMTRQAVDLTPTNHDNYPRRLQNLAALSYMQFQRTGKLEDMNRVAEAAQHMSNSNGRIMSVDQQSSDVMRNFSDAMHAVRQKGVETIEDTERLIYLTRQTLDVVRDTDFAHAGMLNYLGSKLRKRYVHTKNVQDLEEAIQVLQQGIDLTPVGQPQLMLMVCELGITLSVRYKESKDPSDLERMVQLAQQASDVPQTSNLELAEWLNDLGGMLYVQYEQTKTLQDLNAAIRVMQQGIMNTSHPDIGNLLRNLGHLYYTRYEQTQDTKDFDMSLHFVQRALDSSHGDDSSLQRTRNYLTKLVHAQFERTQSTEELDKLIRACQQAIEATSSDDADRTDRLDYLGFLLGVRCGLTKNVNDIKEAIRVTKEGINLAPRSPLPFKQRLARLSHQLWDQCESVLSAEELEEQIQVSRMVVNFPHDNTEDIAYAQANLSVRIGSLYRLTGEPAGIEEAILWAQRAVDSASETHPDLRTLLDNLGALLALRYEHQHDIEDLERGIYLTRQAIKLETGRGVAYAGLLNNLATKLSRRHVRKATMGDLNEAIRFAEEALEIMPVEHPEHGIVQNNLSGFLLHRFQRLQNDEDFERAMQLTTDAPLDSHLAHAWHHALGTQLNNRYMRKGNEEDVEKAISELRKALNLTTDDHRNRATLYHELGNIFGVRFLRSARESAYLEESIRNHEKAVDIVAKDHADLGSFLFAMGISLRLRYEQTGKPGDLENLIRVNIRAWECKNARPFVRIQASISALEMLQWQEKFEVAYNLAVETLELLPYVHGRFLNHEDQQYVVRHFSGLATSACALALQLGKEPEEALKLLEQGRGLILGLLMDDRSNTSPLKEAHPNLSERYESLRANANKPTEYAQENQEKLSHGRENELEELIMEIRQQPGFESFLLPPSGGLLLSAAENGPVVVINVSGFRCDAFLIRLHDVQALPLPDLTEQELRAKARGFLKTHETLAWLWDAVASPVLSALGFTAPPTGDDWPHVWWILTAALSKFPLHAAGRHFVGSTETVIDRVMSSYSPSLKAFIHSRQSSAPSKLSIAPGQALLVAMPDAPSLPMLGHANEEVMVLQALLESGPLALKTIQPGRSKQDVVSKLPSCNIFHFAGHGKTDDRSPIQSSICLEDWKTDPLTVDTLLKLRLHESSPFLAYLSACGTGELSDEKFLDESIHLISACQLAGFRHVIGTLWEVDDQACVDIARIAYEEIGENGMTDESVCLGLHKATRWFRDNRSFTAAAFGREWDEILDVSDTDDKVEHLRDSSRVSRKATMRKKAPLHWVPYVHYGV
ncbi:hypothetical protein BU25DRAFT_411322 [Macroventuria anomochaeta]|uniref:Uncharacterized protein n=1 Tax=Macroventuria anomochaeta TaxID=301207 RepID=A0ACB6RXP3_9PLEO|nr:uncharacterized protein BU25DRAFT_411322 [Macroventuria anomochaeta]KAF2626795.1 hypothetical protein BU25DRAFT_411322 [Macroventuria anomochaeta]